jgi:hypothetical protein
VRLLDIQSSPRGEWKSDNTSIVVDMSQSYGCAGICLAAPIRPVE